MKLSVVLVSLFAIVYGKDWWQNANVYQVYPWSFKDSNNDGVGDLNGVTEKLEYLKDIGVTVFWLSPIFDSPMADFGYDISNYYKIYPKFGTTADLENLIQEAHKLGLRVVLDFVPNHTSDEHEWFQKSVRKEPGYEDFYVWKDGIRNESGRFPPNNWLSAFRYSAWEWNEDRQQYYYHAFAIFQPDLNYRSPAVLAAMKKVMTYWLDKGVDGFRIDAAPFLVERDDLPNESVDPSCPDPDDFCHTEHIHIKDQPETYDIIYQFRELVDEYKTNNNRETILLLTESYTSLDANMKYYGDGHRNGSHVPFNFEIINSFDKNNNAVDFSNVIDSWLARMPEGCSANWLVGNHDQKRVSTRFGSNKRDLLNILIQTLPGVAITYYGEEIGMTDVHISWEDTIDIQACNTDREHYEGHSRDTARTPMQWDASHLAGFSNATKAWLPVAADYAVNNVAYQLKQKRSHLNIFKKLTALRRTPSFQEGSFEKHTVGDDVLVYKREKQGSDKYVMVLNFGAAAHTVDLNSVFPKLASKLEVVTASLTSARVLGSKIPINTLLVPPGVGLVLVERA